jgi:GTP-binding protein YchF
MSLKVGIVGLPNVGKSTLFNALLQRAQAQAENRPFTTIEPNVGIVDLPDNRLKKLFEVVTNNYPSSKPKIIPATIEFVDIAGLVRGAHRGEGLGNQFLSHIREVDAIIHVVRFFEDSAVIHVEDNVNPENDLKTIELELILADLATVTRLLANTNSQSRSNDKNIAKDAKIRHDAFLKIQSALNNEKMASQADLTDEELEAVKYDNLLTFKPILIVANVSEGQLNEVDDLIDQFLANVPNFENIITLCAKVEAELVDLDPADAQEYLQDLGQSEPGLNKLITTAFDLLNLQTYFTAGEQEVRAWTIHQGYTAPQGAGVIHTDFEKGFIKAEVINFEDYVKYNGEQGAKAAGKLRIEGKDYILKNGDVCHFRFNV